MDHVSLKKLTKKAADRISRSLEDPEHVMDSHDVGVVRSYEGVLKWCNGKNLGRKVLKPLWEANESNLKQRSDLK